jgi:ankyrin repeat protein
MVSKLKRNIGYMVDATKPIFGDKERDQIAKAMRDGDPEKLKKLLKSPVPKLNLDGELLAFAISETSGTAYRPEEKLECLRLLFEAGAKLDSAATDDIPVYMSVAENGGPALLRLMMEQGANPNAVQKYSKQAILFEAVASYQDPEGNVRVLLEFGADPNSTALFDDATRHVSPLWRAAELERWGVCLALFEKGANSEFKTEQGKGIRDLLRDTEREFPSEG